MDKHTQGPWTSDKAGGVIAADGFSVGIAFQKASTRVEYEEGGWLERDAVANARLMAAAPELLEALRELLDSMDANGSCQYETLRAAGRDAIARAEGAA